MATSQGHTELRGEWFKRGHCVTFPTNEMAKHNELVEAAPQLLAVASKTSGVPKPAVVSVINQTETVIDESGSSI